MQTGFPCVGVILHTVLMNWAEENSDAFQCVGETEECLLFKLYFMSNTTFLLLDESNNYSSIQFMAGVMHQICVFYPLELQLQRKQMQNYIIQPSTS